MNGNTDRRGENATALEQDRVRLQKVLAAAGVGSRRVCEDLIVRGRVAVNGKRVDQMGLRVAPSQDHVTVDGVRVPTRPGLVYLALNKPRGMVSTLADDRGRPHLGELLADRRERLFHVGRLDADSEGLLLLTNDGELTHRITHPSFLLPKTYLAEVSGPIPRDLGRRLRGGVSLVDGPARVDRFRVVGSAGSRVMVEVVLHEGRNRVVRRLLEAVGHPVHRLVRAAVGPVQLGSLRPGRLRPLSGDEVRSLFYDVGL